MKFQLLITINVVLMISFSSYTYLVFAQVQILNNFSTYTNEEYGIQLEYPSEWQIFGDRVPGDYVTDIAVFAPSSEIKFKEYDSYKDFRKFDKRVLVTLDYRFVIPKLNLNFALDDDISTQSSTESGFKKFELIHSTTNSILDGQKAYEFMFEVQRNGETFKYLTLGTIVNDNQVLKLSFKAPVEEFDLFMPTTFQHMIDSFKIGHIERDPNIATNTTATASIDSTQKGVKTIFGSN